MRIPRFVWVCLGVVVLGIAFVAARNFVPHSEKARIASGVPEGENWSVEGTSQPKAAGADDKLTGGRSPQSRKESLALAGATDNPSKDQVAAAPVANTVVVPSPLGPESWATFRNGYGQLGIATTTLPEQPQELWHLKTSEGLLGCGAVVGGQVYLPCLNGQFLSVDRLTGKPQWAYRSIESTNPNDFAPGFKAAPTVSADTVYVGDEEGT